MSRPEKIALPIVCVSESVGGLQAAVFAAFAVSSIRLSLHRIIISTMAGQHETTRWQRRLPNNRLVGYAWVSTEDQDVAWQLRALRRRGCEPARLCLDTASGARAHKRLRIADSCHTLNLSCPVRRVINT